MKIRNVVIVLSIFVCAQFAQAQFYSTTAGGAWTNNSTWVSGSLPTHLDSVVIQGPVEISNLNPSLKHLTVTENGSITNGSNTIITVNQDVTVFGNIDLASSTDINIGRNLSVYGDMRISTTFTGTADHYIYTHPGSEWNPNYHLYALESKLIAVSDLYILANYTTANIAALEIDLSGGYDLYMEKVRFGDAYSGIRTKLNGGGNSISLNENVTTSNQYFYEMCDLYDVTLLGNTHFGNSVKCYGEVINADTLMTASGPGSWQIDVLGNFTNNGYLNVNLKFNFHQNFTNSGYFQAQDIHFVGTNDHVLQTLNQNPISLTSKLFALEGRVLAGSDIYITSANGVEMVVKDLDLTAGYDLHAHKARIGSSYYSGLYDVRTKITGGGNQVFSETLDYPDQKYFQTCDLVDVVLKGKSAISNDVTFQGEVVNEDSLFHAVSSDGVNLQVLGNFTNNGGIGGRLKFNFHQGFINSGSFECQEMHFVGNDDHPFQTVNGQAVKIIDKLLALEGPVIAGSDLYLTTLNSLDLYARELDLSGGYNLHTNKTRIGSAYYSGLHGFRTKIIGGGNAIYSETESYQNSYYYQSCDLEDVNLMGASAMSSGVTFIGEVSNGDSLFTASGTGGWTVDVMGSFTNNRAVAGDLKFNIHQNVTNNGTFQCDELNFMGTNDHLVMGGMNDWFKLTGGLKALEGDVIAGSDLFFTSQNGTEIFARNLDLSAGFDLHTTKTRIGSSYLSGIHGFHTKITGGGSAIYSETQSYPDAYYFQSVRLHDVTFKGATAFNFEVFLFGNIVNEDSLFTAAGTGGWIVDVQGDFTNRGVVNTSQHFNFHGDLVNHGPMAYTSAYMNGRENQNVLMMNEQALPGPIFFDANIQPIPLSFQWYESGLELSDATEALLAFPGGLTPAEAVFHCQGTYADRDTLSRRIFVGTEPPPPNYPPLSFNLITPLNDSEVTTMIPLLDWEAAIDPDPLDILNYTIHLDTPEPGLLLIQSDTSSSYQFSEPLLDNTIYYWYVVASDAEGDTAMNVGGLHTFIVNTENDLPSAFSLLYPGEDEVLADLLPTLTWSAPDDADVGGFIAAYHVWLDVDSSFSETVPSMVETSLFTPSVPLIEDVTYYWQVQAIDNVGGSRWSGRSSFRINSNNTAPEEFALLNPIEGQQTGLRPQFYWSQSADIDLNDTVRYVLHYGSSIQDLVTVEVGESLSYTVTGDLADNTTYVWQVTARDRDGAIYTTDFANFNVNQMNDGPTIVDLITPDSVQVLSLTPEMYWTMAIDIDPGDQLHYELQWWGEGVVFDSLLLDTNNVILPRELQDNAEYTWQVLAYDDFDGISHSQQATFWTDLFPEAPVAFALLEPADNTTGLSTTPSFLWEVSHDPDPMDWVSYTIQVADDSSFSELILDIVGLYHNGVTLEAQTQLETDSEYWWRVIATDSDGLTTESEMLKFTVGTVAVDPSVMLPVQYVLDQNFPNPFNPTTTMRFGIPEESAVSLTIYDMRGHSVKSFHSESKPAGWYQYIWDGLNDEGDAVPTGVYFTRLQAGSYTRTIKMLMIK